MRNIWSLLKEAYNEWSEDNALRLGAALAYYTVFSIAPLLILGIAVVGLVFGREAAQGRVMAEMQGLMGAQVASGVQDMVANSQSVSTGIVASVIGLITLLVGASGVFTELQDSMNTIWNVRAERAAGWWALVRARLLSFSMVVGVGFLLLVSLIVSTAMVAMMGYASAFLPRALTGWVLPAIQFAVSLAVITVLFALVYKILPDTEVPWRDVWVGALFTAVLFTIGKFLIGLYLSYSAMGSTYGAAGSLILLLAWVYYASQILFFGAELTQVYSRRYGSRKGQAENRRETVQPEQARAA